MNKQLLVISLLIFCFVLPGCKKIIRRKIRRKLDVNVQVDHPGVQVRVIGFYGDGCAPCNRAKIVLKNANIQVNWIKADCYNRGMVKKYGITKVPTLIIDTPFVKVRTHDPLVIVNTVRKRI